GRPCCSPPTTAWTTSSPWSTTTRSRASDAWPRCSTSIPWRTSGVPSGGACGRSTATTTRRSPPRSNRCRSRRGARACSSLTPSSARASASWRTIARGTTSRATHNSAAERWPNATLPHEGCVPRGQLRACCGRCGNPAADGGPEPHRPRAVRTGPSYVRLGRATEAVVHREEPGFEIGRPLVLRDGGVVVLVAIGGVLADVAEAAERLAADGVAARVVSLHTLKPLDA